MWRGKHLVGISSDLSWLPADLVAAADYRLVLPVMSGADLDTLAYELSGASVTGMTMPDDIAAGMTPRVLRLARRPGQNPDDYIGKVRDILARDQTLQAVAKATTATPRTAPSLDLLPGMAEATAWGRDLERDLAAYRRGELPWSAIDKGLLLYGPPGTGKTSFARGLAGSCDVPLVIGSLGQWQAAKDGHLGDLLKAMRATFDEARAAAPAILFVDEIDGFGDRESFTNDYNDYKDYSIQVVNGFLELLDGMTAREGVIVVGACNNPHGLDGAIVRSGRLDRSIMIPLPDRAGLAEILRVHLGSDLAGADLDGAALMMSGGTGADCERHVRVARRRARRAGRLMELDDLLVAVGGTDDRPDAERKLAAVHEAGHAVALIELRPGALLSVSIQGNGRSSGHVTATPAMPFFSKEALRDQMTILLSGRAAEDLILGRPTSGAGGGPESDIARATLIAALAVTDFALDEERSGLMWSGVRDAAALSARLASDAVLAIRVRELLAEAYAHARRLILNQRPAVEALAEVLAYRRVLDGAEAARVVREAA